MEREKGATQVRQGGVRLFDLNAACLVGFAIPELAVPFAQ